MKLKFIQRKKMFCQKENLRRKKSHTLMLNFFLKLRFVRRKKHDLLVVPQTPGRMCISSY